MPPRRAPRLLTLACALTLGSFAFGHYFAKIYYLGALLGAGLLVGLVGLRQVPLTGLGIPLGLVLAYWLWLLGGMLWASVPAETLWWAGIQGIWVLVVPLFVAWGRLVRVERLPTYAVWLVGWVVLASAVTWVVDPEASRHGGYGLSLLPVAVPFLVLGACQAERRVGYQSALGVSLGVLALGLGRAPLGAALLVAAVASVWLSPTWRSTVRLWGTGALGLTLLLLGLWSLPATQEVLVQMLARLLPAEATLTLGQAVVLAEAADLERATVNALGWALWPEHWVLGIGYHQFEQVMLTQLGQWGPLALHRSVQTWGLEGGLPCLVLVGGLVGIPAWRCWQVQRQASPLLAGALRATLLALGAVLAMGWYHQVHETTPFWALVGLAWGLSQRPRQATL